MQHGVRPNGIATPRRAVAVLTRHHALGSAPHFSGAGTLGRRSPQLRHRRPQLGLSSSGEGEASAEPEAAAKAATQEPESAVEVVSETTPLVQVSEETPEVKPESGAAEFTAAFYRTRLITFAAMVTGYAAYYVTRNSLTYTAPFMLNDAVLGLTLTQIGGLTSILPIAYGFSKFLSGVLGARASPRVILAGGLMATAVVNVGFGFGASYVWFMCFWALNGVLQGLGAPACARIITSWFPSKERGTWWGFWTASNNVGGFAAPLIAGTAANHFGWRWGLFAPGIIGLAVGALIFLLIKDDPETAGFAPVEAAPVKKGIPAKKDERSLVTILFQECLKDRNVWLFAITYFFVYVVRQAVTSWFIFSLIKGRGVPGVEAAVRISGLELGGLLGSLSSGAISDRLIKANNDPNVGNVGLRVKVVMSYTVALALFIFGFWHAPNVGWIQWIAVALVGAALYGPQMLIGLCGAETVSKSAVSAAQGFLGWIAYLGAAGAGVPIALIVQKYGWNAYFTALLASCAIILALLAPTINLKSYVQRTTEA